MVSASLDFFLFALLQFLLSSISFAEDSAVSLVGTFPWIFWDSDTPGTHWHLPIYLGNGSVPQKNWYFWQCLNFFTWWSFLLFIYIFNSGNPVCFNGKDSKCCQEQTTNKLTAAVLGGISPFLLNKRKLRSGNTFTREHNGDITAENKAMWISYSFEINIVILIQLRNSLWSEA